ncbi:hypothetical protein ACHAXS_013819 [Conticribra weissflogii]
MPNQSVDLEEGIRFLQCPTNKPILEAIHLKRHLPRLHHELLLRRDNARTWIERDGIEYVLEHHLPKMAESCNSAIESDIVLRLAAVGGGAAEGDVHEIRTMEAEESRSSGDPRTSHFWSAWSSVVKHAALREMAVRRRRWLEDVYDFKVRMDCKSLYVDSMDGLDKLAELLSKRVRGCCCSVPEETRVVANNTSSKEVFPERRSI